MSESKISIEVNDKKWELRGWKATAFVVLVVVAIFTAIVV